MKIIFLGMGEVGKCSLHLLPEFLAADPHEIHIVERNNETAHPAVNGFISRGAHYLRHTLSRENTLAILAEEIGVKRGDIVIDLTTDSDMFHTAELCLRKGWHYLNTCIENSADAQLLHHRNHARMAALTAPYRGQGVATCVFDHGMNPGLISSFVKKGLEDIARHVLSQKNAAALDEALGKADYRHLAQALKLESLHLSELDDQESPRVPGNVFVNTWSCPGFLVEALAPLQLTWGSHEKTLPADIELTGDRLAFAAMPAWKFLAESYVPHRRITGMLIPHEEILTLKKFLATADYCPTIAYVYEVNRHTRACFEAGMTGATDAVVLNPAEHELRGSDRVGALLILAENPLTGERKPWCWWSGTILETTDPVFSATVTQVAAGVLAAVRWIAEHPAAGICFPEDLPHAEILRWAAPHLGEIFSAPVDFSPASTQFSGFLRQNPATHLADRLPAPAETRLYGTSRSAF